MRRFQARGLLHFVERYRGLHTRSDNAPSVNEYDGNRKTRRDVEHDALARQRALLFSNAFRARNIYAGKKGGGGGAAGRVDHVKLRRGARDSATEGKSRRRGRYKRRAWLPRKRASLSRARDTLCLRSSCDNDV